LKIPPYICNALGRCKDKFEGKIPHEHRKLGIRSPSLHRPIKKMRADSFFVRDVGGERTAKESTQMQVLPNPSLRGVATHRESPKDKIRLGDYNKANIGAKCRDGCRSGFAADRQSEVTNPNPRRVYELVAKLYGTSDTEAKAIKPR
jgi:hypothetical protein